ncbi:MAG: DUF116 domain-containing protein [Methanohalophilus sp.]
MYDLIGKLLIGFVAISVLLSSLALFVSRISINRHVRLAGIFAWILDLFYLPIKYFFCKFSDPRILDSWMVSLKNIAHYHAFRRTHNRIMLLPHCMRFLDCPAHASRYGIQCKECGRCIVGQLKRDAQKYGYRFYIITGSSFVKHVLKEKPADGILVVGCNYEINKGMRFLRDKGVIAYGVPLESDGCYNTSISYEKIAGILEEFGPVDDSL